jgi:arabinofuranan 3-O-arabinosyltransferase
VSSLLATRRRRSALGYLLLALVAYVPPLLTARGRIGADTKQYLYLDPGRLLSRSVSMWDPHVGMGTVTHQTIGYAFPMGPYYWVLERLGSPAWISQRLWLGSLLFAAALGVLYLLRTFGLRGPGVVVAAFAYMCTPYVLDYSARISVLLMPWAALPWLIAVTRKALREKGWRYPAIFALIIQVVGGVNATALIYVGVGPVLWILYAWLAAREVDARRAIGVAVRTGALTLLTSLWWISGLRMQGAYGLDVLKYSETVKAVALTSTPNEVLRGLGYWFFYGQDRLGPWIEAARDYTQHEYVIAAGYALVVCSLLAAAFLRWRHRVFFVLLLFVGVVISVGAHPYDSPTPLGALFKKFATSSTAGLALRSTGRAAPLVVLSLAVLLGIAANSAYSRLRARGRTALAFSIPIVAGVLIFLNFPALVDGTFYGKNLQRPEKLPSYWTAAIAALDNRDHQTRILEEPGADFASYTWGNTVDPITPGLTDRPYVARELIPYGTPGSADLLNAIDRRLQVGVADPNALVPLWRRMGVGDVVARNDINYERYDLVRPVDLAAVLNDAPGLERVQPYGPPSKFDLPRGYNDEVSLQTPASAGAVAPVAVYHVSDPTKIVRAESTRQALMVSGDGEGLVDVAGVGLLDGTGVIRYSASYPDPAALRRETGAGDLLVVTDNNRLRARKWSTVTQTVGFTEQAMGADAPLTTDLGDARLDLFPGEAPSALTTTDQVGVKRVVATAYGNTNTYWPEDRPAMALDGDLTTAWLTQGFGDARGQRIQIDFDGAITTDRVNLVQPLTGNPNRFITDAVLTFDGGNAVPVKLGPSSRTAAGQTFTFPQRSFRSMSITIVQTNDHRPNLFGQEDPVGFAEIRLRDRDAFQNVHVAEFVQMPTDLVDALGPASSSHPLVYVMNRDAIRPVPPRTQPELSMNRAFSVPTARSFVLTGSATVSPDAREDVLDGVLDGTGTAPVPSVSSSGFLDGCLNCRAAAAFDGDPATAWQTRFDGAAGAWAQVDMPNPVRFDHLDLAVVADGRHSVPTQLRLDVDGRSRVLDVPPIRDKAAPNALTTVPLRFPAVRGRQIRFTVTAVREEQTRVFGTARMRVEPVAIAEFGVPGVTVPTVGKGRIDSGCRSDLLAIDGNLFPIRITGAAAGAQKPMGLTITPCRAAIALTSGTHVLTTAQGSHAGFSIDRIALASDTASAPLTVAQGHVKVVAPTPVPATVDVTHNGATKVRAHVAGASEPFWLVLGQSRSPGWHARVVGGHDLGPAQLVDGYANGWLVTPPSNGAAGFDVVFEWTPQRQVWTAIWLSLLGALLCIGIIVLTWVRRRSVVATAATARPGDADADLAWSPVEAIRRGSRVRWIAPVVCGVLAALVVAPWVGVVVAGVVALVVVQPRLRAVVMLAPAALLALCALYILVEQYRYRYPSVFEWPTVFPHARTLAWIAVVLLAADAVTEILRARFDRGGRIDRERVDAGQRLEREPLDDDVEPVDLE